MKFNKPLIFISLLLIFSISLGAVNAAEMNVIDDNNVATVESSGINDKINTLNSNEIHNSDEIYDELEYATGIYNINYDYNVTKMLNVRGGNLIIEGNNHTFYGSRAFYIRCTNVTIKNLNFVNCHNNERGGAIEFRVNADNCSMIGCSFVNCSSNDIGGAVYWYGINGVLSDCSFINCSSANEGGGICWVGKNGAVSNCIFSRCISGLEDGNLNSGAIFWGMGPHDGYVLDCVFKTDYDTVKGTKPIYSPSYEITTFDCEYGETATVLIAVDKDVTGTFTVKVDDGQVITKTIKNGYAVILINGLSVGVHKLYISYSGNKPSFNTTANLTIYSSGPSSGSSDKNNGKNSDYNIIKESGIPMEHTANPVFALIFALFTLPLIYRRN